MGASLVVNGNAKYDYASLQIDFSVPGKGSLGIFQGVSSIDYTPAIERAKYWGTSRLPLFGTDGVVDADGGITMARMQWNLVLDFCKAQGIGYFDLSGNIAVVYGNRNQPTVTDTLPLVKFAEVAQEHEQGPDALEVKLKLWIEGAILLNGVPPVTE